VNNTYREELFYVPKDHLVVLEVYEGDVD